MDVDERCLELEAQLNVVRDSLDETIREGEVVREALVLMDERCTRIERAQGCLADAVGYLIQYLAERDGVDLSSQIHKESLRS